MTWRFYVRHILDVMGIEYDVVYSGVGVVVQYINHSPITQEPGVRFQVETMQRYKRLNKQPRKATQ